MKLSISTRDVEGVTVVDLDGRIVLGKESEHLREQLTQLVADKRKKILLNMAKVVKIDSTGLGTLTGVHSSSLTEGGKMKLCSLSDRIQDLLVLTGLSTVFERHNTEQGALASFK